MRWLLTILLLAGVPARAQEILVRTGEHPGYTRIVLEMVAATEWRIDAVPGGWEFRSGADHLRFDLGRIWQLIGRERMSGLRSLPNSGLRIESSCECHVRAWSFNGKPVIDIHDGAPRPGHPDIARYRAPPQVPAPQTEEPPWTEAGIPFPEPLSDDPDPDPVDDGSLASADALPMESRPAVKPLDALAGDGLPGAVDRAARREQAPASRDADDLVRLVEARRRARELEARLRDELLGTAGAGGDGYGIGPVAGPDVAGGKVAPPDASAGMTEDGLSCPVGDNLDPTLWGRIDKGVPDMSAQIAGLTGELDDWNPEVALRLARYYLHLGFGAEARQLLSSLPPHIADIDALAAMADIMDDDGSGQIAEALDGWESCGSIAALWSVLAGPTLARGQAVDGDAVVRSFSALPPHLRQLLGPRLIAGFVGAGKAATAELVRNAMRLGETDPTAGAAVAEAGLERALGAPDLAGRVVDSALAQIDPASPDLLVEKASQRLASGRPLESDLFGALEAIAFEQRQAPLATRIQRLLVRHEIFVGGFLDARQRLEQYLRAQDVSVLYRQLYLAAAEHAPDAAFLRLTIPLARGLGEGPADQPARQALAGRLLQSGFAAEALDLLAPLAGPAEGALIAARAELALGRPGDALTRLEGVDMSEALPIRAAAHAASGQPDMARALYLEAGMEDAARRVAALSGDWARLTGGEDGISIAADALLRGSGQAEIDEPYAEAEQLLRDSARERTAFEALLAAGGDG